MSPAQCSYLWYALVVQMCCTTCPQLVPDSLRSGARSTDHQSRSNLVEADKSDLLVEGVLINVLKDWCSAALCVKLQPGVSQAPLSLGSARRAVCWKSWTAHLFAELTEIAQGHCSHNLCHSLE